MFLMYLSLNAENIDKMGTIYFLILWFLKKIYEKSSIDINYMKIVNCKNITKTL